MKLKELKNESARALAVVKIGGSSVMQRTGPIGGPGHLGLQGPPRSLKISPVKIQDESGDPISQSTYNICSIKQLNIININSSYFLFLFFFLSLFVILFNK